MKNPLINTRQKDLILVLLHSKKSMTYQDLAERFKLSTRTIQREITLLKSLLEEYGLRISKKIGKGIEIKGSQQGIALLVEQLEQSRAMSAFSPEERQEGITYDLLISKDPVKHYVFSKKFGVTETTISHDLDKVEKWLEDVGIKLVRAPGIGVFIEGTEQQRRTMLSRIMHKDISFEEWIELFHSSKREGPDTNHAQQLETVIRNRLLKFTPSVLVIEEVVSQVLQEQTDIELSDRNYVNLIVHLMLAVERVKQGEVIEEQDQAFQHIDRTTYLLAEKIVKRLEQGLSTVIPRVEINYISLHLLGAQIVKKDHQLLDSSNEIEWVEIAKSFIRAVEIHLNKSLDEDDLLLEGLVSHLVPTFNRLKLGLKIHNPMLEKIKMKYPEPYQASKKACEFLSEKSGYRIPEEEIGYLAMHIGASLIRKKDFPQKNFQAMVICASGLGTSTYLSSKIRNEMPNLQIKGVISANQLKDSVEENNELDIFISTINLPFLDDERVVTVSPFLTKEDMSKIQQVLIDTYEAKRQESKLKKSNLNNQPSMISLAKYGEGMMEVLRNTVVIEDIKVSYPVLASIIEKIKDKAPINDQLMLLNDLEKREQQGGFVLGNLGMIHAKSQGVNELLVVIFRMEESIPWQRDDDEEELIDTLLLLAAPKDAPKEHVEMISEISAMLVEESFYDLLLQGSQQEVNELLANSLSKLYEQKVARSLKGK